jgi:hypothetical protein
MTFTEKAQEIIERVANSNFWGGISQGGEDYAGDGYSPREPEALAQLTAAHQEAIDDKLGNLSLWIEKNTGASEDLTKVTLHIMDLRNELKKGQEK